MCLLNQKNIVKENNEYLRIFHLLKWIFQKKNYSTNMCWNGQGITILILLGFAKFG